MFDGNFFFTMVRLAAHPELHKFRNCYMQVIAQSLTSFQDTLRKDVFDNWDNKIIIFGNNDDRHLEYRTR